MLYLNLLLKFWRESMIGVLLLAGGLLYYRIELLSAQKETLLTQLNTAQTKLADCQDGAKKLTAAIEEQNKAIENLKKDAESRAKRAAGELNRANAKAAEYKEQADALRNRPPDPKLSLCDNANNLINQELTRGRK